MKLIKYKSGNIFDSSMQTIVNTVNCVGVMGAGIAKTAKKLYPQMYEDYVQRCKKKLVEPGKPYLWVNPTKKGHWVLNFPTKDHWKNPSRIEWIEKGLSYFLKHYNKWGIQSIAFPALGCGNGGLWWIDVNLIMEQYLANVDIPVEIYKPRITVTEKAVMYSKQIILKEFNQNLHDFELVRSFIKTNDKWIDWRSSKNLRIRVLFCKGIKFDFDELSKLILSKYNVNIKFLPIEIS